jgi:hypothetical protein
MNIVQELNDAIYLQNVVVVVLRMMQHVGRILLYGKHLTNPLMDVFSFLSHPLLYVMKNHTMLMLVL